MAGSDTPSGHQTEAALASLHAAWTDLSAAHRHAIAAAAVLTGARHARAEELVGLIGDCLAVARRLSVVAEGDLRAEDGGQ